VCTATALVAGFAAPAMASTSHDSSLAPRATHSVSSTNSDTTTRSESTVTQSQLDALRTVTGNINDGTASNRSPVVLDPSINAPVGVGNIGSGNSIGSGNATSLISGGTTYVPLLSGNTASLGNNDGDGNGNGNSAGNGDTAGTADSAANGSGDAAGGVNTTVNNLVKGLAGTSPTAVSNGNVLDSILGG
jgi:hypothetical protein